MLRRTIFEEVPMGYSRRYFIKLASSAVASAVLLGMNAPTEAFADEQCSVVTVDSTGRFVSLPHEFGGVVPAGNCAQSLLMTLCPERLLSLASPLGDDEVSSYAKEGLGGLASLPVTGDIYPYMDSVTDATAGISTDSALFVDAGFSRVGLADKLDLLESKASSPAMFMDASFGNLPSAYRILGNILGYERRAECLASFIEDIFSEIEEKRESVEESPKVLLAGGSLGVSDRNGGMFRDVARYVGGEPVLPPLDASGVIDPASLAIGSVDVAVFNDPSCFKSIVLYEGSAYEVWGERVYAVVNKTLALAPYFLYRWIGSVLSMQTIGMAWLANLLHPGVYQFDLYSIVGDFYRLFFGYELSEDECVRLVSKGKL